MCNSFCFIVFGVIFRAEIRGEIMSSNSRNISMNPDSSCVPGFYQGFLSNSLLDLSATTVKNYFYTLSSKTHPIDAITIRANYAESALRSMVSAVYNLALSVIFSTLSMLTLGKVKRLNQACQKYWGYTSFDVSSAAIATLGIAAPRSAAAANLSLFVGLGIVLQRRMEQDLIPVAQQLFNQFENQIRDQLPAEANMDRLRANVMGARSLADLVSLFRNFPQNV